MKDQIRTWLFDIKKAIDEIDSFIPAERNFLEFSRDLKTRRAVERNIEIIGEAVNRIVNADPDIPISNSKKIISTRNRIIHGYDSVSEEILWSIIVKNLPELEREVNNLLLES